MPNNRKAQFASILVLLAGLGVALARKVPSPARDTANREPQDAVYAMLDAARAGDVKTYLASYTGAMQAALRQTVLETNEPSFARYLKDSNAAIKGVAISDPEKVGDGEVRLRVEYIYQDRNEAQVLFLAPEKNGWKISRIDSGERIRTLIPYGMPVR
jgi:hypothetical protein